MIFRLIAIIALPIIAYYFVKSINKRYALGPRQSRFLFFLVVGLLVIGVLVALGRLPVHFILAPVGVAFTFLLRNIPMLFRFLPLWQMFSSRMASARPRSDDQVSTIRTSFLQMELRHSNGDMEGQVLKGQHRGKILSALSMDELIELYQECAADADSAQVLEAYLDRNHQDWRRNTQQHERAEDASADESAMSRSLALEILGLDENAEREEIVKAHRNLMQKMHPDRGGSDYLAKKINLAKDFLLDSGNR
jgi:hypothetical protein